LAFSQPLVALLFPHRCYYNTLAFTTTTTAAAAAAVAVAATAVAVIVGTPATSLIR
jgi:hypothetical protein